MSDTHFTKGPWESYGDWMIRDSNTRLIAQFEPLNNGMAGNSDESWANGNLIAAAPDLYEALDNLVTHANGGGVTIGDIEKSLDALAKARGEQ